MKRRVLLSFAMLMLLCICSALAAGYPQQRGDVNDDAAVLSLDTANDIAEFNKRLKDADFVVVTRHFLGGAEVQSYCDGLFDAWNLQEDQALLLLVIGEERYAVHMGAKVESMLSKEQMNSLLSSRFRSLYITERNYDGAVGTFLQSAGERIAQSSGHEFTAAGLFGTEAVREDSKSAFENWKGAWWEGFFGESGSEYQPDNREESSDVDDIRDEEDSGFSVGKLIFIVIVLSSVVKKRRRAGKSGLGLIGWVFTVIGAKEIGKLFRGRR